MPHDDSELKFVLPGAEVGPLGRWLAGRFPPDGQYPANTVWSIYFDTLDAAHVAEKENSDFLKSKVRLRWYADPASRVHGEAAFMELKAKAGARREKVRVRAPFGGPELASMALTDIRLVRAVERLAEHGEAGLGSLMPVLKIGYLRRRFVEPVSGARIALDADIRLADAQPWLGLRAARGHALPWAVVEVKGGGRGLPPALWPITAMGCVKRSFSKYFECWRRAA